MRAKQRGLNTCLNLLALLLLILFLLMQDADSFLCCQRTLLGRIPLAVYQVPRSFSAELVPRQSGYSLYCCQLYNTAVLLGGKNVVSFFLRKKVLLEGSPSQLQDFAFVPFVFNMLVTPFLEFMFQWPCL